MFLLLMLNRKVILSKERDPPRVLLKPGMGNEERGTRNEERGTEKRETRGLGINVPKLFRGGLEPK